MAEKIEFTVYRAMHGDGKDYARGDTRRMTEADAADLVASGALAKKGDEPLVRGASVTHAFGEYDGGDTAIVNPSREPSVKVDDKRPVAKAKIV